MSRITFIDYVSRSDSRNDPDFEKYEVATKSLADLASGTSTALLAIGLKGTGKSAAFRYLERDRTGAEIVQSINAETQEPQDVESARPVRQYLPEIRADLVFQALAAAEREINANSHVMKSIPSETKSKIRTIVNEFWKKVKSVAGTLGGITILGFGATFRPKSKESGRFRLVPREGYIEALSVLKELVKYVRIRIVVDDPESIFTANDEVNENLVAALVIASHELQVSIPRFKCIILIKPNVLRKLRRVDEFVSLPIDIDRRLTWTNDELFQIIERRAEAAGITMSSVFGKDPLSVVDMLVADSRSGPRDILRRLEIQLKAYPDREVSLSSLSETKTRYASACYDQMYAAYDNQYPGVAQAALSIFSDEVEVRRSQLRLKLEQMIAINREIFTFKDQEWARDYRLFSDLLVEFGLVAIKTQSQTVLPFHALYLDEAMKSDALFVCIPGLRSLVQSAMV